MGDFYRDWDSMGHLNAFNARDAIIRAFVEGAEGGPTLQVAGSLTATTIFREFAAADSSKWASPLFDVARAAKQDWFKRGVSLHAINAYLDAFRQNFVALMAEVTKRNPSMPALRDWLDTEDASRDAVALKVALFSPGRAGQMAEDERVWRDALAVCDRQRRGLSAFCRVARNRSVRVEGEPSIRDHLPNPPSKGWAVNADLGAPSGSPARVHLDAESAVEPAAQNPRADFLLTSGVRTGQGHLEQPMV